MIPGVPQPSPGNHVVAMPYPGRGHINPMMNLCSLLLASHDLTITLVLTEEWLGLVGPIAGSPNLRFQSIPNVVPSEHTRGNDFIRFLEAVLTEIEAPFERFIDRLDRPVSCIIADIALPWMQAVGRRRNIPVLSLWTQAPSMFSVYYHFELLAAHKHFPDEDLQERGEEVIDYLPGLSPMRLVDLPCVTVGKKNLLKIILDAFSSLTKAQGLLFTSCYELQPQVTSTLKANLPIPLYTIGPSIPYFSLQSPPSDPIPSYFHWLDSQPESSVLFVSLGSYISLSSEQMEEISTALKASQIRYLWIVRGGFSSLHGACGELGLIVPWCEQLRVLCHPSVGGFMTHCGWNSIMEGIFAGVPMLAFPLAVDQFHNCKLIVEDWRVGLRLKQRVESTKHVVGREEIAQSVKRLMNLNGSESIKLRRRAEELKETCMRAIKKGGSTDKNVNDFVKDFVKVQYDHAISQGSE